MHKDRMLSYGSLKIIREIVSEYKNLSNSACGIGTSEEDIVSSLKKMDCLLYQLWFKEREIARLYTIKHVWLWYLDNIFITWQNCGGELIELLEQYQQYCWSIFTIKDRDQITNIDIQKNNSHWFMP